MDRDFASDGIPDRLTTGSYMPVDLRVGLANGTFAAPLHTEVPPGVCLATAEFNGNSRLDVVMPTAAPNWGAAVAGFDWDSPSVVAILISDGDWPPLLRSLRIIDVTVMEGNAGNGAATFIVTQPFGNTSLFAQMVGG